MKILLRETTAYKILSGDRRSDRLSHAYMLHFQDGKNLRAALKLFATEFFGVSENSTLGQRIEHESYTDLKIYPQEGKKIAADGIAQIIEDSAMRPVEGNRKLYIICGFETASALIQNKLLKTLEEPLEGVHFLLGATTLSPVLDTVRSRVKLLEIPPFSEGQIYSALERTAHSELNAAAAKSANGVLGVAENMVSGGWFETVLQAAEEICSVTDISRIGEIALKYGDIKYKNELLGEMQRKYFTALTGGETNLKHSKATLIYAIENIPSAVADVKFNAFFQGLLYNFMLKVVEHGRRTVN